MTLKRRLEKLEPLAYQHWRASWQSYTDRFVDRLPQGAIDLLVVMEDWPEVTPEVEADVVSYERELFTGLGLDQATWNAWNDTAQAAQPEHYEEKPTPYHLMPERMPAPPCNPIEALQATHSWTYPSTAEGRSQALIALVLAQAVEVSSVR